MGANMELVKHLKERTGAGLMDCKKALEEADNDVERAIRILKERGFALADKKAERETREGVVHIIIKGDKGIIIEVDCETDFVARNEEFKSFVQNLAEFILSNNLTSPNSDVENLRKEAVMKFGENIVIRGWEIFGFTLGNTFDFYKHGEKLGVVVEGRIDKSDEEALALLHDISLQVAAMDPKVVKREDLDPKVVEEKKREYKQEFIDLGKPETIAEKAAMGKLSKFFSEVCLYDQPFIRDEEGERKVSDVINDYRKKSGKEFEIVKFYRYQVK